MSALIYIIVLISAKVENVYKEIWFAITLWIVKTEATSSLVVSIFTLYIIIGY
jgi:hypothetical protein